MKSETFTTIILEAEDGKYLTQASKETGISERVLAKKIALGRNDSPANWVEITEEEAREIESMKAKDSELGDMP